MVTVAVPVDMTWLPAPSVAVMVGRQVQTANEQETRKRNLGCRVYLAEVAARKRKKTGQTGGIPRCLLALTTDAPDDTLDIGLGLCIRGDAPMALNSLLAGVVTGKRKSNVSIEMV